jgi:hypothetical protein
VSIDTRLQDAARAVHDSVEHMIPDRDSVHVHRRTIRTRLALAGAAVAMVAVVGFGITILGGGPAEDPSALPTVPETTLGSPTTLPVDTVPTTVGPTVTAPTAVPARWASVDERPHSINQITTTRLGFVTSGFNGIWSSDDGSSWKLAADLPEGMQCEPASIVEFRDTVIGVGCGPEHEGSIGLLAWVSTDDDTWSTVEVDEYPIPYAPGPAVVAAGQDRVLVAVDTTGYPRFDVTGTDLWGSEDGLTWTHVAPDESGLEGVDLVSLAPTDEGFVGIGIDRSADDWATTSVWISDATGMEWEQVEGSTTEGESGERLVAIASGVVRMTGADTAISFDGRSWETWLDAPTDVSELQITDASPFGSGIIVAGLRWENPDSTGQVDSEIWRADPLNGWSRIPDPDGLLDVAYAWEVAGVDDVVVVIGEIPDPDSSDPTDRAERIRTWVWSSA